MSGRVFVIKCGTFALTGLTMGALATASGAAYASGPIEESFDLGGIPPICTFTDIPYATFDLQTGRLEADLTVGVRCLGVGISSSR